MTRPEDSNQPALVSVVIPCFNDERLVTEAIESALTQSYPNIEVVVVDDGSTDASAARARACGDRVRVVAKENGGLSSARNFGVDHAAGEYLVFLDADDLLDRDFVSTTMAALDARPDLAFVYTQFELFGRESRISTWPEFSVPELVKGNYISATSLIRASVFDEVRFDESMRAGWEDWDFFLSLVERGHRGQLVDEPLLRYRKDHERSRLTDTMVTARNKRRVRLYIMRKHLRLFGVRRYSHYLAHHVKESGRSLLARMR